MSQRRIDMGFSNMHSEKFGLVLNFMTVSIYPQYHVVYHGNFYTVVSSTYTYTEVWIRLFTSNN